MWIEGYCSGERNVPISAGTDNKKMTAGIDKLEKRLSRGKNDDRDKGKSGNGAGAGLI